MNHEERMAQQAIALSDEILGALVTTHNVPNALQYVLSRAKHESAKAMRALIFEEPTNAEAIRTLQFEAQLYSQMVMWLRQAFEAGREATGEEFAPITYSDACELYDDIAGAPDSGEAGEAVE